jgi:acetyltransferase-like isoleucine patch superfamily enzyme
VPPMRLAVRALIMRARWGAMLWRRGVSSARGCRAGPRFRVDVNPSGRLAVGRGLTVRGDADWTVRGVMSVGDDVYVNRWSYISCFESLTIGDGVRLGERVSIHDENHDSKRGLSYYVTHPVMIGAGVWVGANCVILAGANIGPHSVVAAGSVVRGTIPGGCLAAGVPARVIREL